VDTSVLRTNLKTLLAADATLTSLGTVIHKYPPGEKAVANVAAPIIGFNAVTSVSLEDGTILASSTSDQTYLLEGGVFVKATDSSDAAWATAEQTANSLIERVRVVCIANQTLSGIATQTRLVSWDLTPTADNAFVGEFQITVRVVD
jgi:hypothetical protein